tara:strand:- start:10867 stop:11238 length:372 start_codon:yes stop_codon:yes gene_type:complete
MINVYKIYLEGGGDIEIKFVDKEVWDWINNPDSGNRLNEGDSEYSWEDQTCPPNVKADIWQFFRDGSPIEVTSGSWENDRALLAPPLTIKDRQMYFFSETEIDFTDEEWNDINIVDTYYGYIY